MSDSAKSAENTVREIESETTTSLTIEESVGEDNTVGIASGIEPGEETATVEVSVDELESVVLSRDYQYESAWLHARDGEGLAFTDHLKPLQGEDVAEGVPSEGVASEDVIRVDDPRPNQTLVASKYLTEIVRNVVMNDLETVRVHVDDAALVSVSDTETDTGYTVAPLVTNEHPEVSAEDCQPQNEQEADA